MDESGPRLVTQADLDRMAELGEDALVDADRPSDEELRARLRFFQLGYAMGQEEAEEEAEWSELAQEAQEDNGLIKSDAFSDMVDVCLMSWGSYLGVVRDLTSTVARVRWERARRRGFSPAAMRRRYYDLRGWDY